MLNLFGRTESRWDAEPLVVKLCADWESASPSHGLVLQASAPGGTHDRIHFGQSDNAAPQRGPRVILPKGLSHLGDGDIVRLMPRTGDISVLYRRSSPSNGIFLTERCNNRCIMCSQPPRDVCDDHLVDAYLEAIPHMDGGTEALGITGGEPTLLGDRLIHVLRACKEHLPATGLHLLSNGRLFNYQSLCREVAGVDHPDLMIGIPLHSDLAMHHDFVAQAKGAFDQTIRGMINLKRFGQRVEIRVVIHRLAWTRLPQLARFIARNLPFADQVCLMGLEPIGFAKTNRDALWMDPFDYMDALRETVHVLLAGQMNVLIYNHQLCVLDRALWPYARQSISDWKTEYLDVCEQCAVRKECGGFFASSRSRYRGHIQAVNTR